MPHRQNTQHQKSENFAQKRDGLFINSILPQKRNMECRRSAEKESSEPQILPFCFYLYSPFILNRLSPKINSTRHNQNKRFASALAFCYL